MSTSFEQALQSVLPGSYREGLQGLARSDHERITCSDTRNLAGSVHLDEALAKSRPNDTRWDYGIGVRDTNGQDKVVWVESIPRPRAM